MTVTLEIDERIHIRHRFGSISVTEHKIVYSVTSWQNVLDYASQQPVPFLPTITVKVFPSFERR